MSKIEEYKERLKYIQKIEKDQFKIIVFLSVAVGFLFGFLIGSALGIL